MKLGPFEIENPFILAPMAGISHSPFRRLTRELGSAVSISELVSANGLEFGGEKTARMLRFHENERPIGIQIFGEDQDRLCRAAQRVEREGADFVDLNLGCPVPKVVKKGAGAAMCRDPKKLCEILTAIRNSIRIPLTIKVRTGWDAHSINVHEVVEAAQEAKVSWVAVHGRTRAQGYSGKSDWDLIAEVKERARIPILGNGDLNTPELACEYLLRSKVDAVLIGRGALRNPFIFRQAHALLKGEGYSPANWNDYREILDKLRVFLEQHFGDKGALLHCKKFISWYASGFPGCHALRAQIFQSQDSKALWELAQRFFEESFERFDESGRDRDLKFLSEPFLMGGHG